MAKLLSQNITNKVTFQRYTVSLAKRRFFKSFDPCNLCNIFLYDDGSHGIETSQGVFINPAFIEPFGLTLIEVCSDFNPLPTLSFKFLLLLCPKFDHVYLYNL